MASDPSRTRVRHWVTAWFGSLRKERGFSLNTIQSYKDAWRLLFRFGEERCGMAASQDWRVGQVGRELVLAFLDHLEVDRRCSVPTRNLRLAALQSFFSWLRAIEPPLRDHCDRVLGIHCKRSHRPVRGYMEADELKAVLEAVDLARADGMRDLALLSLSYNSGARVHEIAALQKDWVFLGRGPTVRLWGKGKKQRELPLWEATAQLLRVYLRHHRRPASAAKDEPYVFLGQRGERMTRFGVARVIERAIARAALACPSLRTKQLTAHSMRHTTAVHLLQSGADLITIQNWLGHENLETVRIYLGLDLKKKRDILDRCLTPAYVDARLHADDHPHQDDESDENWLQDL